VDAKISCVSAFDATVMQPEGGEALAHVVGYVALTEGVPLVFIPSTRNHVGSDPALTSIKKEYPSTVRG
jgi:hypothetical protein